MRRKLPPVPVQPGADLPDDLIGTMPMLRCPRNHPAHLPVQVPPLVTGGDPDIHDAERVVVGRHHDVVTPAGKLFDLELRGQPAGEMQAGSRGLVETVEATPSGQADTITDNVHNTLIYTTILTVPN